MSSYLFATSEETLYFFVTGINRLILRSESALIYSENQMKNVLCEENQRYLPLWKVQAWLQLALIIPQCADLILFHAEFMLKFPNDTMYAF
jgi:hypothetical protein